MGAVLLLRDICVLGLTLALWALELSQPVSSIGLALLVGFLTTFSGFLAHEWGHWVGARLRGSVVQWPDHWWSLFLFRFDCVRNNRSQFLWMSSGGFIASAIVVGLLLALLPLDRLAGQAALALTILGVIATFVLEVPTAWKVWHGAPLPDGAVYINE